MKRLVPIMAALLALPGCGEEPIAASPMTPSVRLAAVPGRPASGYFQFRIAGDRGALVSVTSPQAGRIEMHETMMSGNMTSMRPIARLAVHDGETVTFAPGGRHLMLYGLDPSLGPGRRIALILHFEKGPAESLDAQVTAAGDEAR